MRSDRVEEQKAATVDFERISAVLNLDPAVKQAAEQYYQVIVEVSEAAAVAAHPPSSQPLRSILAGAAIFVASRSASLGSSSKPEGRPPNAGSFIQVIKLVFGSAGITPENVKALLEQVSILDRNISVPEPTRSQLTNLMISFAMVQLYHTRFTEIMKCITLNDPQNDVMGPEYSDRISNLAWMLFILLRAKYKQHKNEIPLNAYMLQTTLEVLLTHSSYRYDVHFCQMKNGEAIELVIKGKQKRDMAADIQENVSKVVGIELDTEVQQKIKEFTDHIRKILSEVFKQPLETLTLEDKLVDLNRLMFLAKQLDDRYSSQARYLSFYLCLPTFGKALISIQDTQAHDEEIDETMFIKSSNFTPLTKQAIANFRVRGDTGGGHPTSRIGGLEHNELTKHITIKSRLSETIRFPSTTGLGGSQFAGTKSRDKYTDSFSRFSEMYQWMKERITECNYVDYQASADGGSLNFKLTSELSDLLGECESKENCREIHQIQENFPGWLRKLFTKPEPELDLQFEKLLKLYLSILEKNKILDKLVREEYNHNGFTNLTSLLADSQFLRSVAAVALEIEMFIRDDQGVTLQS